MTLTETPTIAQAAHQQETLWQFLATFPFTQEFELFVGLFLSAIVGMFANYFIRWAKSDEAGTPLDYFWRSHFKLTVLAVCSILAECATEAGTNLFLTDTGIFVGWATVLVSGFKTGWLGDAALNKGTRAVLDKPEEGKQP